MILLLAVLLGSPVSAQTAALRAVGAAPLPALAPSASAAASVPLAAPSWAAASPSAVPFAAPALAALPAPPAAADGPAKPKGPGAAPAAAALSEFARLVADLMSGDPARAEAAAAGLRALKDAHLNRDPEPQKTRILDLKPMQIPAGMYEVQAKAKVLRGMKEKEARDWLKENSVPYVEDYKGRKRPVDHHHETRAAWEADLDDAYAHPYLDAKLHARLRALDRAEFYAVTRAMGLFYDRDQFGAGPHDPNHLPEDVRGMADDPYRSVAWQVRKRGGYLKTDVPFAEFAWAGFFRARLKTYPTKADFEAAVVEALRLAHSAEARGLPGWTPG